MFKFLKGILTEENNQSLFLKPNLVAVDNKIIRDWHYDKVKLRSGDTETVDLYNTNENPNQLTKGKFTQMSSPGGTILNSCGNPFGLPDDNAYMLYYVIRYGVALIEEDCVPSNWYDLNYYMNQDFEQKPFLLALVPKDMQIVDEGYKIAMTILDYTLIGADYHDGEHSHHINLNYINVDSEINPFLSEPLIRNNLTLTPRERFEVELRRAFKHISIARLIKKYGTADNYHPLLFPEHKEYVDNLLSLDSLYKETMVNASKLTTYFRQEGNNMNFDMREQYINKIMTFGTKLNEFVRDYNQLTVPIDEFNDNLGKKKVELTHQDFLSQFD